MRKHWPYPARVAHRGAGKLAPENTLAAMRLGQSFGYRMFEFDVKLSGDGTPFLLHDATLDRTTNGTGRADALTWGELAKLDAGGWHSPAYTGEPVPTLSAIARWTIANALMVNIEIKPTPGRERETGAAVAQDALSLWHGQATPPLLSSFSDVALRAAREVAPDLPAAYLFDELPGDWLERIERLGCIALDCNHRVLDEATVALAHAHGLKVLVYTPNEPEEVDRLTRWGIDCVITDAVDLISPR